MKIKYVALNSFLKEKVSDSAQFSRAASVALGLALGRCEPVPANLSALPREFYLSNIQPSVERQAADFNENIVIDLNLAEQVARSVWLIRAGFVHPEPMIDVPEAQTPGDVFTAMSGAAHTLSADLMGFMEANRAALFVMANRITATLCEDSEERRG